MSTSPTPPLNLSALLDPPTLAAARRKGRVLCRRTLSMSAWEADPFDGSDADFGFDEPKPAQRCLHDWAHTQATALAFLTGCYGEGKTDLLLGLVERMARTRRRHPEAPVPLYVDLARLVNHRRGSVPHSLAGALSAELARRELPAQAQALLQAVSDGQVVLILDHAEAVAPYHASVWQWMDELPAASAGQPCRRAHVLLCCRQEWFADMVQAKAAASTLQNAREGAQEAVYLLHLQPVGYQDEGPWLEAAGIDLTDKHPLYLAWNCFGRENRALPARLQALKPLFAGSPSQPPTWQEVHSAWWRHHLPADLGLDDDAMVAHATALDLMQARQPTTVGELADYQHTALIERQWPEATPAQQARIAMAARVGLQLRGEHGRVHLPKCHRWLAQTGARAIADGDLDALMTALVDPPRRQAMTEAIAEACCAAGHSTPPLQVSQWLREPQNPRVSGALFELGCAIARAMAWHQARTDRELLRTATAPKSSAQYLRDALALAWPSPLSAAHLRGADLRRANLRGVQIEDADLSEADLTDADFSQARLVRVTLDRARASGACFNEAEFTDVQARSFVARSSQWLGARWNRRWPDADLREASTSVPGIGPDTAETEFRFIAQPGATVHALRRLVASADGRLLAALDGDNTLSLWRGTSLQPVWQMALPAGPAGQVLDLCFSHDGSHVLGSQADASLCAWSTADGALATHQQRPGRKPVRIILLTGDGEHVLGLAREGQGSVFGAQLQTLPCHPGVLSWSLNPQTCTAAVARRERHRFLLCVAHGGVLDRVAYQPPRPIAWGGREVNHMAIAWSEVSAHEWLALQGPQAVTIGNPDASAASWQLPWPSIAPDAASAAASLVFSRDGRWLVGTGTHRTAFAFDTLSGTQHALDPAASAGAVCAAFAADGQLILGGERLVRCPLPARPVTSGTP